MFLAALRADGRQTHRCHSGGQELEENGRRWTVRLATDAASASASDSFPFLRLIGFPVRTFLFLV